MSAALPPVAPNDPTPPSLVSSYSAPPEPKQTAWRTFLDDVHVNCSGIVLFGCAVGSIWVPSHGKEFAATATAASMYLFAASKAK